MSAVRFISLFWENETNSHNFRIASNLSGFIHTSWIFCNHYAVGGFLFLARKKQKENSDSFILQESLGDETSKNSRQSPHL